MDYLNTMRERNPDFNHPTVELISSVLLQILLDPNQSAITSLPPDVSVAVKDAVSDIVSRPIFDLQRKLYKHTKWHSVNEVNSR